MRKITDMNLPYLRKLKYLGNKEIIECATHPLMKIDEFPTL
jgi:hypothetical protein